MNNGNHHDEMYLQSQEEWLQMQDDTDFRRVYVKTWTPYLSRLRRHEGEGESRMDRNLVSMKTRMFG